jgi:hypothetical protein
MAERLGGEEYIRRRRNEQQEDSYREVGTESWAKRNTAHGIGSW